MDVYSKNGRLAPHFDETWDEEGTSGGAILVSKEFSKLVGDKTVVEEFKQPEARKEKRFGNATKKTLEYREERVPSQWYKSVLVPLTHNGKESIDMEGQDVTACLVHTK